MSKRIYIGWSDGQYYWTETCAPRYEGSTGIVSWPWYLVLLFESWLSRKVDRKLSAIDTAWYEAQENKG